MLKNMEAYLKIALCLFLSGMVLNRKTINAYAEEGIVIYRLYNSNSGEHFYTGNMEEKNHLTAVGWRDEGVGWTAPLQSAVPVYRLYNQYGGEHHYTANVRERDALIKAGWKDEGIGWYSYEGNGINERDMTPLYRQYNPNAFANNHNYTANTEEKENLLKLGWRDEKVGWYGISLDQVWNGQKLTAGRGKITGPSGTETWYNLDMTLCVQRMHFLGYQGKYHVRKDGVKMLGDYVMIAADLKTRPLGTLIKTSLGKGIVVDTGDFVKNDPKQIDIAVNW